MNTFTPEEIPSFTNCDILQVDNLTPTQVLDTKNIIHVLRAIEVDFKGKPKQQILASVSDDSSTLSIVYHLGHNTWGIQTDPKFQQRIVFHSRSLNGAIVAFEEAVNMELPLITVTEPDVGSYPAKNVPRRPSL